MDDQSLEHLYEKVDRLIQVCERLQADNHEYKSREEHLLQERTRLLEKNELARVRVDSMIRHLKSLQLNAG